MRLSPSTLVAALVEGRSPTELARLQTELHRAAALAAALGLARLATNPRMTTEARDRLAAAVAKEGGLSAPTERVLALALEHGLVREMRRLVRAFDRAAAARGVRRLVVTTAAALPAGKADELRAVLPSDDELTIETRVDPTILGGIRLQLDDRVLDQSHRTRLRTLRARA